jgi:hypothetical protein
MVKRGKLISLKINKRAQFFIISAAIIAVLLVGLATVVNYVTTSPTPTKFYDLSKYYDMETAKVVDYGVYQKYTPAVDIEESLRNFTNQFYLNAKQKYPDIEIIAIFGNSSDAKGLNYAKEDVTIINSETEATTTLKPINITSLINFNWGADGRTQVAVTQENLNTQTIRPSQRIKVRIRDLNYTVNLDENQNFYFIIMAKKPSGEVNVVTTTD